MLSLGGWEWLILAGGLILGLAAIAVVVAVVSVTGRRKALAAPPPPPASAGTPTIAARLAEVDHLLRSGLIDEAEHQAMRARILDLR